MMKRALLILCIFPLAGYSNRHASEILEILHDNDIKQCDKHVEVYVEHNDVFQVISDRKGRSRGKKLESPNRVVTLTLLSRNNILGGANKADVTISQSPGLCSFSHRYTSYVFGNCYEYLKKFERVSDWKLKTKYLNYSVYTLPVIPNEERTLVLQDKTILGEHFCFYEKYNTTVLKQS